MLRRLRMGLGFIILGISILFLVWGCWPAHRELRVHPVSAVESTSAQKGELTLLFPPKIRLGEPGIVHLTLEVDALNEFFPNPEGTGPSNFYDTHTVITEARFDLAGMDVRPSDLISAPISQGQSAVFYWNVRPQEVGQYRGTIWLSLRYMDKLTGEEARKTISAQIVEIEAVNFLGLSANLARATGMAGSVIGMVLSLPFFESFLRPLAGKTGRKM